LFRNWEVLLTKEARALTNNHNTGIFTCRNDNNHMLRNLNKKRLRILMSKKEPIPQK
jgi:hypothetical protein